MTGTPDAHHGELLEEEGIVLSDTSDPTREGEIRYSGGEVKAKDAVGVFGLRGGGTHATTHSKGGSDEVTVQNLGTGLETIGQTLQTDGSGGVQLIGVVPGYPPAFATVVDETTSSTTLTGWQQKISLATPSLESGGYIMLVQAVLSGSKSNSQFAVRSQFDNTDTFGTLRAVSSVPFSEYQFFAHTVKSAISGVHTIDIDYRYVGGSGYVTIRGARITFWRVSGT